MAPVALEWVSKSDLPDDIKQIFLSFIRKFPLAAFVKMSKEMINKLSDEVHSPSVMCLLINNRK